MIPYYGLPCTPETAAVALLTAANGFLSPGARHQQGVVITCCRSFAVDNGAFPAWQAGKPITDWGSFYEWADELRRIPSFDFAVIPDVIDGDEAANDALVAEWPLPRFFGAPVWHLHESLGRLQRLVRDWPRVCIGSSGEFTAIKTEAWWRRMDQAMRVACDEAGRPLTKLHGLRMLDPAVFTRFPLASADSTNIARNIGIDKSWTGSYPPSTKEARVCVMRSRIEKENSPARYDMAEAPQPEQGVLL